jgi:4-amino-4-deoxychorismate lyase
LHYGDGLFETFAVIQGQPQHWNRHYQRLSLGCERLQLPVPEAALLQAEAAQLCEGVDRAVLKLILTRGPGDRGYRFPQVITPTRIFSLHPWPDYPTSYRERGVKVRICAIRLARNPTLAGIKHLNRLEQVMARNEWVDPEIAEGLMLDTEGYVIEGTMTNLFLAQDGILTTPDLSRCGILGIMREHILEAAADLGISIRIQPIRIEDVYNAQEAFVCNSIIGIWPIRHIHGDPDHSFGVNRLSARLVAYLCGMPGLNR